MFAPSVKALEMLSWWVLLCWRVQPAVLWSLGEEGFKKGKKHFFTSLKTYLLWRSGTAWAIIYIQGNSSAGQQLRGVSGQHTGNKSDGCCISLTCRARGGGTMLLWAGTGRLLGLETWGEAALSHQQRFWLLLTPGSAGTSGWADVTQGPLWLLTGAQHPCMGSSSPPWAHLPGSLPGQIHVHTTEILFFF